MISRVQFVCQLHFMSGFVRFLAAANVLEERNLFSFCHFHFVNDMSSDW